MLTAVDRGPDRFAVGVDVGGTFTDLAVADAGGQLRALIKTPSKRQDPVSGIIDAIDQAAMRLELTTAMFLGATDRLIIGTTIATNLMLERTGALVGLLTTEGFRDSLAIRRGKRDYTTLYDFRRPHPEPVVPRWLRLPVVERISAQGEIVTPLDERSVMAAIATLRDAGVASVAISLLHAYREPEHERRIAELIERELPEVEAFRSSEVLPLLGEYERTSTTAITAYVAPAARRFLADLDVRVARAGLATRPLITQSNGGVSDAESTLRRPAGLILSGPAAGAPAASLFADRLGSGDVILLDMGGTSTDVTLVEDGRAQRRMERQIGGLDLKVPSVDVESIGTGGGTVAFVDPAGLLHVGPRGAGADPGPAAYGKGGLEPTVTDANLVLGRLSADNFLGGAIRLDEQRAREAIHTRIAEPLGLSIAEGALAIIQLANENMIDALKLVSIQRGRDPRRFTLLAAGGATGLHASSLARALEMPAAYMPREAGAACAIGAIFADLRQDEVDYFDSRLDGLNVDELESAFARLESAARARAERQGMARERLTFERLLDMRYVGQHAELTVMVASSVSALGRSGLAELFHSEHERVNGHRDPDGEIEILAVRVTSIIGTVRARPQPWQGGRTSPNPRVVRDVIFDDPSHPVSTPVFRGEDLAAGARIIGPAIIEEVSTTLLVMPGDAVDVDSYGGYRLSAAASSSERAVTEAVAAGGSPRGPNEAIDPTTLAIVERRLDAITREMGATMSKAARSLIFSEAHDFSCFVGDPDGTVLSQADGIPIHTGSGGFAIRAVMRAAGESLHDRDVWLLNDPYFGGGAHLPDWVMVRPVFENGRLLAFVCNKAHQNDLGGNAFGGYNYAAREIFQEGIRLPAVKLVDRGLLRDDVFRLLCFNSRLPDQMAGDLRAMLGSLEVGVRRLRPLSEELGIRRLHDSFEALLDYSERRMMIELAKIPDGTYRGTNPLIVSEDEPDIRVPITVEVGISGGRAIVDFRGTSGPIPTFKNSARTNSHAAVYAAFATIVPHDVPHNEGAYRAITVVLPDESVVNAKPPLPVGNSTTHPADEIIHACWQALARVMPDLVSAGWGYAVCPRIQGIANNGRPFIDAFVEMSLSGAGAVRGRDGFDAAGPLETLGGLTAMNLEMFERLYPIRYERCEFRVDTGGPGEFRGGTGLRIVVEGLRPMRVSAFSRLMFGKGFRAVTTFGVRGGSPGAATEFRVLSEGREMNGSQAYEMDIEHFTMEVSTEGGGGWGDPEARDRAAVARDLRDGLISASHAASAYRFDVA